MTSFGINNEGQLIFDYYHEDTDQLNGANVYNGQNSLLWNNFRQAFADEIRATYQDLRNSGKLTYDILVEYFITNGANRWSANVYNEDSDFKYISMARSDNDTSNLSQVRGSGEEHFKYFVENRLNYCDSKWYASDYANDYVSLRIYTPQDASGNPRTDLVVAANADITVTPFSNMYAGVRYKANGTLQQQRAVRNIPVLFTAPNETFNDTETAVYGASEVSSLGDLAPLYCGSINVSKATKLIELKVGDATTGYSNPNLTELSVGTNKLLKKIDVRNCPNLTDPLGLANCPNIEEIYATGSGITGVELAESGYLKTIKLPGTITNLTLKNQLYINDFSMEGYSALKTLRIENCPTVDAQSIIANSPNLERIRLTDVKWNTTVAYLRSLYKYAGLDENGLNTDKAHISGTAHITSLTGAEAAELKDAFPYLTITFDNMTATVYFMSEDGSTQLGTAQAVNGGDVTYTGSTPTKTATAQYTFTFDGWSTAKGGNVNANALKNVNADRYVYAHFDAIVRVYTVTFYNGSTLLQTVNDVPYGGSATYEGDVSQIAKTGVEDPENYTFTEWAPSPTNITGNTQCYATFSYNGYIKQTWAEISQISAAGQAENYFSVGDCKQIHVEGNAGNTVLNHDLCVFIIGFDHNSDIEGTGITFQCFKSEGGSNGRVISVGEDYTMNASGESLCGWAGKFVRHDILGSTDGVRTSTKYRNINPAATGAYAFSDIYSYSNPSATCATNPVPNTLMSCLPADLRAVMKPITKYTNNSFYPSSTTATDFNSEADVTATLDYLPILSLYEMGVVESHSDSAKSAFRGYEIAKQAAYSFYKTAAYPQQGIIIPRMAALEEFENNAYGTVDHITLTRSMTTGVASWAYGFAYSSSQNPGTDQGLPTAIEAVFPRGFNGAVIGGVSPVFLV